MMIGLFPLPGCVLSCMEGMRHFYPDETPEKFTEFMKF